MTDTELRQIAARAWAMVKGADDPDWLGCIEDHRSRLAYKVQSVIDTGALEDNFDRHVYAILHPETANLVIGRPLEVDAAQVVAEVAVGTEDKLVPDAVPTAELEPLPAPEAAPKPGKSKAKK